MVGVGVSVMVGVLVAVLVLVGVGEMVNSYSSVTINSLLGWGISTKSMAVCTWAFKAAGCSKNTVGFRPSGIPR